MEIKTKSMLTYIAHCVILHRGRSVEVEEKYEQVVLYVASNQISSP